MRTPSLLVLLILSLTGCATTRLALPNEPVRMTVLQRHTKAIPGSQEQVQLSLDDITGGQVLLSIRGPGGKIVDTVSVKNGDVVPFAVGRHEYYLRVVELRNFLTGDDFGVFEISAEPPRKGRLKPL